MYRLVAILTLATAAGAQTIECPAAITVTEKLSAVPGWRAPEAKSEKQFERVSIYNGDDGGREYQLAPPQQKEDGRRITQTWPLKDYRDMNLFLRCHYRDTQAVLSMDIPPGIAACTFTFTLDARARITGKAAAVCR